WRRRPWRLRGCRNDYSTRMKRSNTSHTYYRPMTTAGLAAIVQDDPVKFRGSISRSVNNIRVAAATIWKALNFGSPVCFADLFAVDHRVATYVVSAVSQSGDSGSWIVEDPSNPPLVPSWYGMLIAGDRQQSYACYAEHLLTWAKSNIPCSFLE